MLDLPDAVQSRVEEAENLLFVVDVNDSPTQPPPSSLEGLHYRDPNTLAHPYQLLPPAEISESSSLQHYIRHASAIHTASNQAWHDVPIAQQHDPIMSPLSASPMTDQSDISFLTGMSRLGQVQGPYSPYNDHDSLSTRSPCDPTTPIYAPQSYTEFVKEAWEGNVELGYTASQFSDMSTDLTGMALGDVDVDDTLQDGLSPDMLWAETSSSNHGKRHPAMARSIDTLMTSNDAPYVPSMALAGIEANLMHPDNAQFQDFDLFERSMNDTNALSHAVPNTIAGLSGQASQIPLTASNVPICTRQTRNRGQRRNVRPNPNNTHNEGTELDEAEASTKPRRTPSKVTKSQTKAVRSYICTECNDESFQTESLLHKHRLMKHIKPYRCIFQCYGCTEAFGLKHDWSRHIAMQHLQLAKWVCSAGKCGQVQPKNRPRKSGAVKNVFYRKDLFVMHVRRKHKSPRYLDLTSGCKSSEAPVKAEFEAQCYHKYRDAPENLGCPDCALDLPVSGNIEGQGGEARVFETWNERLAHIATHLETRSSAAETADEVVGIQEDNGLRDWMLDEGLLRCDDMNGSYELVDAEDKKKNGRRSNEKGKEKADIGDSNASAVQTRIARPSKNPRRSVRQSTRRQHAKTEVSESQNSDIVLMNEEYSLPYGEDSQPGLSFATSMAEQTPSFLTIPGYPVPSDGHADDELVDDFANNTDTVFDHEILFPRVTRIGVDGHADFDDDVDAEGQTDHSE